MLESALKALYAGRNQQRNERGTKKMTYARETPKALPSSSPPKREQRVPKRFAR